MPVKITFYETISPLYLRIDLFHLICASGKKRKSCQTLHPSQDYEAVHMMYTRHPALEALCKDIRAFLE